MPNENSSTGQPPTTSDNDSFVLNELLCFLSWHMNVTPKDHLVNVIQNHFDKDDITIARDVLHQHLPEFSDQRRRILHRSIDKMINSMYDWLQQPEAEKLPKFVAWDLRKLPAVDLKNIDGLKLIKKTGALSDSVAEVKENQNVMAVQIAEIADAVRGLQKQFEQSISTQHSKRSVTNKDEDLAAQPSGRNINKDVTYAEATRNAGGNVQQSRASNISETSTSEIENFLDSYLSDSRKKSIDLLQQSSPGPSSSNESERQEERKGRINKYVKDSEGFLHRAPRRNWKADLNVNKNTRKPLVCGTRKGSALRVLPPRRKIFVTNLHTDTTVEDLETYVKYILNNDVADLTVEKITSKLPSPKRASFVIDCHKQYYETLLQADSWEEDVRVRPYYPARAPKNDKQKTSAEKDIVLP